MERKVEESLDRLRGVIVPMLLPLGVKLIAVFGSAARGEAKAESDIDIFVELKKPEHRLAIGLKWFRVERELSQALGRRVDLVSAGGIHPLIRPNVERDMVVLYVEG